MLKYAFYLPQFHQIPENDEWWGEGFTEWTNVRNAKPLYPGHKQPIHPADDNYYNLLEKSTVEWQTKLAREYCIDGFVYYHYYFCGKKLLEKPAENLLKWKDVPQNFFFCWANHNWNRAWHGTKEVLLAQEYGSKEDWEAHFEYLLPFFKDERYLKIDNKPAFMIFVPFFKERAEMMTYFDERCKEEGFEGIYVFESFDKSLNSRKFRKLKAEKNGYTRKIFIREPTTSRIALWESQGRKIKIEKYLYEFRKKHTKNKIRYTNGNDVLRYLCKNTKGKKFVHGMFFSFDNTPRHGKYGQIIKVISKENFFRAMDRLKDQDIVIFNAWNEWAEGMVMEPTKEYGNRYLSWVKEWTENI